MVHKSCPKTLDYTKPIIAQRCGEAYLLMPHINKGSYEIVGYDWFSLILGRWNSCRHFKTPQEAVVEYAHYDVCNADSGTRPSR